MQPDICVLIPHYNNITGLEKSLESVSNLEPTDVLIVDDGSKEKPNQEYLQRKFQKNINRITVLINKKNRGIEHVLNDGLKYIQEAGYKYIARLDCGDICFPERFKIQKEFLESNPEIDLVGSWAEFIDKNGKTVFTFTPPTSHKEILKALFINNVFIHPSVMFRTSVIEKAGFYPTEFPGAEDYAYFFKIAKVGKVANINKVLIYCELNPKGISLRNRKEQIKSRLKIILYHFDFSSFAFYGLIRNSILYFTPYKLVETLKRIYK